MGATIDPDQVRHVGKLARIELTDQQVQTFGEQLAAILHYFDKLQQLDTEGVEPMAHAIEFSNVLAADELGACLTAEQALANAPQREGDHFRVPKVLGGDSGA